MGLDLVSHLHLTVLSTLFSVYWHNALDLSGIAGIMPCMCPNSIGIIAFFCDAIRKQTYFYGACLSSMDWLAMHAHRRQYVFLLLGLVESGRLPFLRNLAGHAHADETEHHSNTHAWSAWLRQLKKSLTNLLTTNGYPLFFITWPP